MYIIYIIYWLSTFRLHGKRYIRREHRNIICITAYKDIIIFATGLKTILIDDNTLNLLDDRWSDDQ